MGIAATGLHATAQQGGMTKIEWSAASSADLNASDRKGRKRLHVPSFPKQREAIPALIKTGANLQLTDQQGNTPLQMAISRGYAEMVKMLSVPAPASK